MQELFENQIEALQGTKLIDKKSYEKGRKIYESDACLLLSISGTKFDVLVEDGKKVTKLN